MAFVVEDGTGKSTANSYLSVADADTYWGNHGSPDDWTSAQTTDKESALQLATQYLDATYHCLWKGRKNEDANALDWPRYGVVTRDGYTIDSDEMPQSLKDSTAEMALRDIQGVDLIPDIVRPGDIKRKRAKAGSVEVETEYMGGASQVRENRIVKLLISDLIDRSNRVVRG